MSDQTLYLIHCILGTETSNHLASILNNGLSSVQYRDIAAIVREVDSGIVEDLKSSEAQLRDWLAIYQQTNIHIFRHCTILPLKFGTIVDTKEEIETFLSTSYMHLKWALDMLKGKLEFAVQLSWDLNAVIQKAGQDEGLLSKAIGSVDSTSRSEIGRLLFQKVEVKKREILDTVYRKLSEVSLDSSDGRCADEAIIMNRSYLIDRSSQESFDEAMAELGRENESYLSFKYIGPIPPYSFAPLEFKQGNFELIDNARKKLSLPERATFADVKSAYRRLSLESHPDKNMGDRQSLEHFKQIDAAYRTLETYCCYSCERTPLLPRERIEHSFAESAVDEVFIVKRTLPYAPR